MRDKLSKLHEPLPTGVVADSLDAIFRISKKKDNFKDFPYRPREGVQSEGDIVRRSSNITCFAKAKVRRCTMTSRFQN